MDSADPTHGLLTPEREVISVVGTVLHGRGREGESVQWSGWAGSNRRPPVPKTGALPLRHTPYIKRNGFGFTG